MKETGAPADKTAQPAQPEPAPEPTKAEPTKAEPTKAEPTKAEPAQSEPAQSEPIQPEPAESAPRWRPPRWMVGVAAAVAVLVLLGVALAALGTGGGPDKSATGTASGATPSAPTPSAPAGAGATPPTGPQAGAHPVRAGDDLARVCDGWYYPQSPKFAGKAPHQISVGVVDSMLAPRRHMLSAVRVPDQNESIWRAWTPDHPAKSQLVACLDLTRPAKQLRTCKYKDQTPATVALVQGVYRLRLYETATGRKLLDKPVTGADGDCPSVVFVAAGESLYSEVTDTQLYRLLRPFVMQKRK
ncbi:hypothetical protein ACFQS1_15695 [Paractinoplanes rhizophilus]|uniref:Serine/threonine protein kinase n=1 Tax=Paractinoplanes rhizophilus TaxID=1416877 RepID=A0ABW2HSS4_9ACTN